MASASSARPIRIARLRAFRAATRSVGTPEAAVAPRKLSNTAESMEMPPCATHKLRSPWSCPLPSSRPTSSAAPLLSSPADTSGAAARAAAAPPRAKSASTVAKLPAREATRKASP